MAFSLITGPEAVGVRASIDIRDMKYFRLGVALDSYVAATAKVRLNDRLDALEGVGEDFGCIRLLRRNGDDGQPRGRYALRLVGERSCQLSTGVRLPSFCIRERHGREPCELLHVGDGVIVIRLPDELLIRPAKPMLRVVPSDPSGTGGAPMQQQAVA